MHIVNRNYVNRSGMLNLRTEKANHAQLNEQLLDLGLEVGDLKHTKLAAQHHAATRAMRMLSDVTPGS